MEIEIVDFYPIEQKEDKGFLSGTLRVKLDIGIHILGVYAVRDRDRWFFSLPGRRGTHHETGLPVKYPFIVFEDHDKHKAMMASIREKAPVFIEKRLVDTENPLVFPSQQKKEPSKPKLVDPEKGSAEAKKEKAVLPEKPVKKASAKVWMDPPKKESSFRNRKYG